MTEEYNLNRLFWHSRRGMLELDLLLVPFVKEAFSQLNEQEKQDYVTLLTSEDQDLFSWLLKKERPVDPKLAHMVDLILAHNNAKKSH